ncbi:MAG: SPOR domain-containing protein, partial [Alphaproteobacteria bacterium]|nr:SPOR domain-containing protein [Alphaproteobacteria bacterium]
EKRKKEKVHVIAPPEEVLSINEMDSDGVLSEEEKQKINNAFDELIPEKEYKIQYVKNENQNKPETKKSEYIVKSKNMKIVEEESLPPIKRIESTENTERKTTKKQKIKLSDLVNNNNSEGYDSTANGINSNIMVQIASLPTKNGAEVEYRRIANKNRFIKKFGKKIYKVDLGAQKGSRYRIQIGPFRNTAEARQVISELKNNGCSAYISR